MTAVGTRWFPATSTVSTNWLSTPHRPQGEGQPGEQGVPPAEPAQEGQQAVLPARVTVHMAFSPRGSTVRHPRRVTVKRSRVGSSHSTFQNSNPPLGAQVEQPLGKGPLRLQPHPARRALVTQCSIPAPLYQIHAADGAGDEQLPGVHGPQLSSPLSTHLTMSRPPDMRISSAP